MRGGKRNGSGRPKGARDKGKHALEALQAVDGELPMKLWARVLSDKEASLELRLSVARDMAPYVHAKKAQIQAEITQRTVQDYLASLPEEDEQPTG